MTKTVEEVRRAAFEAKFPIPKGNDGNPLATWVDDEKLYRVDVYPGEPYDDYGALWEGFNAALEAVEIELPHEVSHVTCKPFEEGRDAVLAAIEQTGLGLRVK